MSRRWSSSSTVVVSWSEQTTPVDSLSPTHRSAVTTGSPELISASTTGSPAIGSHRTKPSTWGSARGAADDRGEHRDVEAGPCRLFDHPEHERHVVLGARQELRDVQCDGLGHRRTQRTRVPVGRVAESQGSRLDRVTGRAGDPAVAAQRVRRGGLGDRRLARHVGDRGRRGVVGTGPAGPPEPPERLEPDAAGVVRGLRITIRGSGCRRAPRRTGPRSRGSDRAEA